MTGRRTLITVALLAAALHGLGVARTRLPAQDGLKFLRVARDFQSQPWTDVVRGTDQHPLYPALVAAAEPAVRAVIGRSPTAWRLAAQLVSALAMVALLPPLHGLAAALFNRRVADLAALGFVLLPLPMAVGHDTLSDSLALLATVGTLRLGLAAVAPGAGWRPALGCGLAAGLGFLARPEVLLAPLAVVAAGSLGLLGRRPRLTVSATRLAGLGVAFLAVVGSYAVVKGEVSEKLAVRQAAALGDGPRASAIRRSPQWLPPGLDDPRWDFAPKEEAPAPKRAAGPVVRDLLLRWADGLGGVLAVMAVWGLVRDARVRRAIAEDGQRPDPGGRGRLLVGVYLGSLAAVLVAHELRTGYLSDRHTLTLVTLSLPWAAAGVYLCGRRLAARAPSGSRWPRVVAAAAVVAALAAGAVAQAKPSHPSRWGHWAAGRWLADHAGPGDAVLDTRGWAAFTSGLNGYDYWHVRQALTDPRLAYVVVGDDELNAPSRRGATLRAVLGHAARPAAWFPAIEGGGAPGVWVFRYRRPESWEGLRR